MSEFNRQQRSGLRGRPTWIAALVVLVVGSAGLTAVGGIAGLKSWLVKVNIDGEVTEVQTDANGEANFTVDTADGEARVSVKKWEHPAGEEGTRIKIQRSSGAGEQEAVEEMVRKRVINPQMDALPLETLGDAEPDASWKDATGALAELYILPDPTHDGTALYLLRDADGEQPLLNRVGGFPVALSADGPEPVVTVADDGVVTVEVDDGQGRVMVAKLKMQMGGDELHDIDDIEIPSELGDIKVGIEEVEEE